MSETIEIHGESSVDWQATAMQYIELNKQKTEAIQRVRELHKRWEYKSGELSDICQHCHDELYPCPTIKALDGEIGSAEPVKSEALDGEQG